MELKKAYKITCHVCGHFDTVTAYGERNQQDAENIFRRAGWNKINIEGNNGDTCPDCIAEYQFQQAQERTRL